MDNRDFLRRFVDAWELHCGHYEAHYRAVANGHPGPHHGEMMRLLDEAREELAKPVDGKRRDST